MAYSVVPPKYKKFHELYTDPSSEIFLDRNNERLKKFVVQNPQLGNLTEKEILAYKSTLTLLSKDRERQILRGRIRYLNHRRWITYGPNNICNDLSRLYNRLRPSVRGSVDPWLVGPSVRRSRPTTRD